MKLINNNQFKNNCRNKFKNHKYNNCKLINKTITHSLKNIHSKKIKTMLIMYLLFILDLNISDLVLKFRI